MTSGQDQAAQTITPWMIVEDEVVLRTLLQAYVNAWGHTAVSFFNGRKAIAYIDAIDSGQIHDDELPTFAILDIRLPGATGIEVGARIRISPRLKEIPIVLITAYFLSDQEKIAALSESGADKVLYKPLPDLVKLQGIFSKIIADHKLAKVQPSDGPNAPALLDDAWRWAKIPRTPDWIMLSLRRTKLAFELLIHTERPDLVAKFRELEALNRGLIHDLHNSLKALDTLVSRLAVEQTKATDVEYAKAFVNRGVDHARRGEYDQALADYSQAILIDPALALAHYNRFIVHGNLQNWQAATVDYHNARDLDPKYEDEWGAYRNIELNSAFAGPFMIGGNSYEESDYVQVLSDYEEFVFQNNRLIAELCSRLEFADCLLESVSEARFRCKWNPNYHSVQSFQEFVEHSLTLAKVHKSDVDYRLSYPITVQGTVYVDKSQIIYAMVGLLVTISEQLSPNALDIEIQLSKSYGYVRKVPGQRKIQNIRSLEISFNCASCTRSDLADLLSWRMIEGDTLAGLLMLVTRKIILRHGGSLTADNGYLYLELPATDPPSGEQLREDIDRLKEEISELENDIQMLRDRKLKDTAEHLGTATLTKATATLLAMQIARIPSILSQAWPEGVNEITDRIRLRSRFAQLLARDLAMTDGEFVPKIEPLAVESLFEKLYRLREEYLEDCKVEVGVEPDTLEVLGDELGLLQVLVNLANNAVEAMEEGEGTLRLRARKHPDGAELLVEDTGCGIPSEELASIFDLFYTTKSGHERGIGLHIVKSIISQLNGEIRVESKVDKGTRFIILLPSPD